MAEQPQIERRRAQIWQTLRFQFAVWTAGLLLIFLVSFGIFVYFSMMHRLSMTIDTALKLNASQAQTVVELEGDQLDIPDNFIEGPEMDALRGQGFVVRLLNSQGQVLRESGMYRTLDITHASQATALKHNTHLATLEDSLSHHSVRLYTVPIIKDNRVIGIYQVGQGLTGIQDTLHQLLQVLMLSIPVLVLFAGISGYILAARALAPIDAITRTARQISAEDLTARLHLPPTDDEVGRLAATFDGMLARLDTAFQRERQFTADASHELRTPLAAMQTILDVIREKRRTPDEYEQALDDLAEEAERLRGLAEHLLHMVRNDGQQTSLCAWVDLSMLLEDVSDSLRPLAEDKGLTVTCTVTEKLMVLGDTDSLIRLFANLVDNAIKYTEQGSIILIAQPILDTKVEVRVTDTGIGIPTEHLPHIFERFYRVDASRTSNGAGLGLSIAQAVAQSHGGSIKVDSVAGKGTTLTVLLPVEN